MQHPRPSKLQLRLVHSVFVLLFLLLIFLLHWLSQSYQFRFDWTANAKNSLSAASIAAIRTLDKPVKVTAFVSERANLRRAMREIFAPYQRHKPDIELEFVNPDTDPDRTRQAGVRAEGSCSRTTTESEAQMVRRTSICPSGRVSCANAASIRASSISPSTHRFHKTQPC